MQGTIRLPMIRIGYLNADLVTRNGGVELDGLLTVIFTLFQLPCIASSPTIAFRNLELKGPNLPRAMILCACIEARSIDELTESTLSPKIDIEINVLIISRF